MNTLTRATFYLCLGLIALMLPAVVLAQDDDEADAPPLPTLTFGSPVEALIDARQTSVAYRLEALRCDFIALRAEAVSGDLDPVVTILDPDGMILHIQDDSAGRRDVSVEPLAIPQTGDYTVVVARFGYDLGTTAGRFALTVERIGNGSSPNCAMRYGDTVFYSIDDTHPQVIYSFRAAQGDIIDIEMVRRSGDLDPYVRLADATGRVLAANDDLIGVLGVDSAIQQFVVPQTGTYFIVATRYGFEAGQSAGNFSLQLSEADDSGLGNSPLTALPIGDAEITLDDAVGDERPARYFSFTARQNDLVNIRMTRLTGDLDALLVLTNASLNELTRNDDASNETQNAAIRDYLIPADGTYTIIATRFEQDAGTTGGTFRLSFENQGDAFGEVPPDVRRIQYGTSLTGNIDATTPSVTYAFWGRAGDVVRVTMDRSTGDLDPVVNLRSADGQTVLFSDDDGGANRNARIDRFSLPTTGVYLVEATGFSGGSGSYVLVLARVLQ